MTGNDRDDAGRGWGAATFLISDVVDSTRLWQQHPSAMADALAVHDDIVRQEIDDGGGVMFGVAGDSFAAAFADPLAALETAARINERLALVEWQEVAVGVRIGIHTGRGQQRDGAWFGADVNLTGRVQGHAGSAQVLVSETTQRIVGSSLDTLATDLSLTDVGRRRLRSFDDIHRLFRLDGHHLSNAAPIDVEASPGNLPNPSTSFVGRADELDAHQDVLEPGALLTILGLGGLGKTRTAIELARRGSARFDDGVWWIDLTPVTDRPGIVSLIASTMAMTPQSGVDPEASLLDSLRDLRALVVLDNCEHLIDTVASFVAEFRSSCPAIGLLATSREALGLGGEQLWRLEPLSEATGAVELLLERAVASDPLVEGERFDRADLEELCQRLDGLPLGIEMAAARLRSMSPREMMDRLDDRFRLLRHRRRDVDERHQTLLATVDWSYDLLDTDERLVLDRLSVFAGTFDVALAHEVCGDGYDEYEVMDLVESLVDRSLVQLSSTSSGRRYRVLETIRDYGDRHLDDLDRAVLQKRLAPAIMSRLERCEQWRLGVEEAGFSAAWQMLEDEWDNVRKTLHLLVEADDGGGAESLLQSIWAFSFETFRTEVRSWATEVLAMSKPPPIAHAVEALWSWIEGDITAASSQIDAALVDLDPVPDPRLAYVYQVAVPIVAARRSLDARTIAERAVDHADALADSEGAYSTAILCELVARDEPEAARVLAEDVHAFLQRSDNPMWAACLPPLASAEARLGDPAAAHELCGRAVELVSGRALGFTGLMARLQRARIAVRHGVGEANADLAAAIVEARRAGAWFAVRTTLSWAVPVFRDQGDDELADRIGQMGTTGDGDEDRVETVELAIAALMR